MTGLERNSDVVVMSSYAPLFGHEEAWQWRPNLIWFDNLHAYATPNYYVQQLVQPSSRRRGAAGRAHRFAPGRACHGPHRIGHYRLQRGVQGSAIERKGSETLFTSESLDDTRQIDHLRRQLVDGRWRHPPGDARAQRRGPLFGDPTWRDYTLSLKARKLAGRTGLAVIVRNSEGGSFLQWTLGGWGNRSTAFTRIWPRTAKTITVVGQVPGSIEPDRWYDLRIELSGSHVRCYLDGALVHDLEIPPPDLPRLFATASRDIATGEVILKVVNPTAQ